MSSQTNPHMIQALKSGFLNQINSKLNEAKEEIGRESANNTVQMNQMIEDAVKRQVEAYCAENLPRMIKEQLEKMAL